jgi:hypothetical protein
MNLTNRHDEKGIALILTLGILSFLLILALGFASSAIVQKKAAGNLANVSSARLLAESALERVVAGMGFYADNVPTASYDVIVSHETADVIDSDNNKNFDTLWRITTIQNGIYYYEWPSSTYDKDNDDALHWQYVYDAAGGGNDRIIGRVAYVVVPSGGKLDPAFCVSHNNPDTFGVAVDPKVYPTGIAVNEGTELPTANDRPGKDICEINLLNLTNNTGYMLAADATNLSTKTIVPANILADGTEWASTDAILGVATTNNQKMQWNEWLAKAPAIDNEQFWMDDADGLQEAGEWYHRFNIARTDWDNDQDADLDTDNADKLLFMTNYILKAPSTWAIAASNGDGIPWLNNWGEFTGNWPNVPPGQAIITKKKQIAANIIDYCDSDSIPTTDLVAGNITYMGLDKTPYINEIGINVECTTTVADAAPNYRFTFDIKVYPGGERIDMYSGMAASDAVMTIQEGSLTYTFNSPSGATTTRTQPLNGAFTLPITPASYKLTWGVATTFPTEDTGFVLGGSTAQLTLVKVQILKIQMEWPSGTIVDYAKPDGAADWSVTVDFPSQAGLGSRTDNAWFSYQIDDPRHNLNAGDWDQATGLIAASYPLAGGTPDAVNTAKVTCATSGDAEAGSTPTTISTAYIRNAPMQSPWELGFIHRAAKWETINLHEYNSDDDDNNTEGETNEYGARSTFGGMAYSKGDANILDQIKLTDLSQVWGKVNIRAAANVDIVRALLANIRYGQSPSNWAGAGAGTLDYNTDVVNFANAIYGSSERPFLTRAKAADVDKLSDGSEFTQNTDALKEEIIGKFINLTKTALAEEFTVIVLAQAIKDVGATGGITIKKDLNYDSVLTGVDLDGTVGDPGYFWDGTTNTVPMTQVPNKVDEEISNCLLGQYDLGADEILAEQKIMAKLRYDSSAPPGRKWIITRFEYIEE